MARWKLVWLKHDLEGLLLELDQVSAALLQRQMREGISYFDDLRSICSSWTVHVRYSSRSTTITAARRMLDRVARLKEMLK